ncbi:MAG: helical backbone metal receptor [Casimicrobiaceae bacterium]
MPPFRRVGLWRLAWLAVALATVLFVSTAAGAASPQRIVSLAPHITELLFEAGVGERIVGVTEACDTPPAARRLPRVANHHGANIEAIVALGPDLVLAWPAGNRAADLEQLRRLGLRVETSNPRDLRQILAEVRRFAAWAAPDAQARVVQRLTALEQRLARLERAHPQSPRLRVFYQLGSERLFTLSDHHFVGQALRLCGAENLYAEAKLPAPEASREAVLAARPQAILVADPASHEVAARGWRTAGLPAATPIVAVDGARLHRPTLASFDAVEALCATLERLRSAP